MPSSHLRNICTLLVISASLCICRAAKGQQYSLAEWKQGDGLPSDRIYAITQTPDGFLWLGTADGLVRYDGAQFVQHSVEASGLRPLGQVQALAVDSHGALFAGTASGLVVRIKPSRTLAVSVGKPVVRLHAEAGGRLLVQTSAGVQRLQEDPLEILPSAPRTAASALACPPLPPGTARSSVSACMVDHAGGTWIGTYSDGVYEERAGRVVAHYQKLSGLTSDRISTFFEDREANIWVGTQAGLNKLRPGKFSNFVNYRSELDLPTMAVAGDGASVWTGSRAALQQILPNGEVTTLLNATVTALASDSGSSVAAISGTRLYTYGTSGRPVIGDAQGMTQLAQGDHGALWLYGAGPEVQRRQAGTTETVALKLPAARDIRAVCAEGDGLWLALDNSTLLHYASGRWQQFALPVLSPQSSVSQIALHRGGGVWIVTDAGLLFFDGRHFSFWNRASGLPGERLQWAVEDTSGHLWIGYSIGVARVSVRDLFAQVSGAVGTVQTTLFDAGDGLQGNPELRGPNPAAISGDGSLWFTTSEGLARLDTMHLSTNWLPPPTHILEVVADRHAFPLGNLIRISPHPRTLQFSYAGLSFADPSKNRFRYRLDGFDDGWQDAENRRTAFYTNLKAGKYTFHVISSNNDGVWNRTGDAVALEILPTFYERWWFNLLCGVAGGTLLFVTYRLRSRRQKRNMQMLFDTRIAERNRIAGDLHDHLIQEVMGVGLQLEIADAATPEESAAKKSLQRALALTRQAIGHGRGTLQELRGEPSTWTTIERRLRELADFEKQGQTPATFLVYGPQRPLLADASEEILLIAQEALRNAFRHAPGSAVQLSVVFADAAMTLSIHDEGPGWRFEGAEEAGHFGVRGMHERAARMGASLVRDSSPGNGTLWRLVIPASRAYFRQGGREETARSKTQIFQTLCRRLGGKG